MILTKSPNVLYHGSTVGNLKVIKPHVSTHNKAYVYATPYLGIAVGYLGKWNDFDISTGTYNDIPYMVERYSNAIKTIFKHTGYIYTVDGSEFRNEFISGSLELRKFELVCDKPVKPISMEKISSPYNYILNLPKNILTVYMYPNRPEFIPEDDRDLIDKAHALYNQFHDDGIFKELYKKHPNLMR